MSNERHQIPLKRPDGWLPRTRMVELKEKSKSNSYLNNLWNETPSLSLEQPRVPIKKTFTQSILEQKQTNVAPQNFLSIRSEHQSKISEDFS